MSRETTGTGSGKPEAAFRKIIDKFYEPTKAEIEAKATFHFRIKEGVYAGTPESEWTNAFINKVTGLNLQLSSQGMAWFKNLKSHDEMIDSMRESMVRVISEIMHRDDLPPASRLKAVELAMKAVQVYDDKKGSAGGSGDSGFSVEEEEALRAAGQGDLLDIMKKKNR
jgi:hypothetical protein